MAANKTADVRYAPEDPSLPKPWKALIDAKTNYIYFWNPQTNITQYQKPGTSNVKPESLDKCVSVAICSPVHVQQSSQIPNQEIPTIDDDSNRNSRDGECRPNVDSGERSDQSVTSWMFREGTAVEVAFQTENFNIWHVGTVVKATVNNKCLVKYQCPGDVNQQKIEEFANSPDIRPSPPSLEDNYYFLFEKVEAFFEFCWWSGKIRRLLEDRRYIVQIKHANKEMTFDHADLRPCMVWTDGKWITEAKYNKIPSVLTRQSENSNGQQRRAEEQQDGNGCVSAEKKDGSEVHVKEIVDKECSTKEVNMSLKNVKGARSTKNCNISQKEDQAKQSRDQEIHTIDRIKGSTKGNNSSKRKRGRAKVLSRKQIGKRSTGAKMDMKDICGGDEAKLSAKNDCVMSTTADEIPNHGDFHASSQENMAVNTSARKLRSGVRRHNAVISRIANIPLLDDQAGETVSSKRVNQLKNSVSNGHGETSRIVDSESRYQGCHENYNAKDDNMMIDDVGDINDDQPLSMWLNVPPPVGSDDSRALPVQDHCANNAKGGHDGFKTPPVAKVDKIKPSPLQKTDGPSPGDLPIKNLNGCAESNDKGCELGTPAIVSMDTMENEALPFVKRSPLWKNIDSMEIYKTKKPHFSPLVKCIEETREGSAIGIIVNFSNLVENTAKLQFSSDIAIIERSLEAVPEFESHGFDVEKVRACLTQLLSNKQRANELQKEYDDIGSEISNGLDEGKADEEINQLYQKFREIKEKLAEAKLKKEIREKTISALQSKRDVVGETVQSLQAEFESIVGSLYEK